MQNADSLGGREKLTKARIKDINKSRRARRRQVSGDIPFVPPQNYRRNKNSYINFLYQKCPFINVKKTILLYRRLGNLV